MGHSVNCIDVHKDRLAIRLRSQRNPGAINLAEPTDDRVPSVPWQKQPFKRFREILVRTTHLQHICYSDSDFH